MVCAKCQRLQKATSLATPAVKRKSDMYYGSPASTSTSKSADKSKSASTSTNSGIGKNKLLSKGAKNPYAAYSSSCGKCKKKTPQGHTYCTQCAYKENVCASCGKGQVKKSVDGAGAVVQGQRFSAK
ncbi:MAG: hypothetical protein M1825_002049 [Sarcosagium campestre]|nr:MAG: hypothetical protein M1825_002049 [Sarcosagium campestre]